MPRFSEDNVGASTDVSNHMQYATVASETPLVSLVVQFLVLGFDGDDEGASERRQAARPHHIALGDEMLADGSLWYGAALTGGHGEMIGSMYIVDFPSRDDLDSWLEREPYVTGGVWQRVEIHPCSTREPWQFNRPKEFFDDRKDS